MFALREACIGDAAEIARLAGELGYPVDAAARGGGVGRELVADAEQWALGQGFDVIGVRSNVLREGSHPFYERLGFARVKTQHMYRKALG